MDNLVIEELKFLPQTSELWNLYLASDKTFADFHKVTLRFTEEIRTFPYQQYNLEHFYTELVVWTIKSLKSTFSETKDFLKAYQACLNLNIFSKNHFDELVESLNKTLKAFFISKDSESKLEFIIETFKTLALSAEKIVHMNDRQGFRESMEKSTLELFGWVNSLKNEKLYKEFLSALRKLIIRENSNVFCTVLLDKKCVLALIGVIKYYFFESFLFSELKPLCEEELIFELYYFLVQEYRNSLDDLKLEEIMCQLLNNDQNFDIVSKIFEKLLERCTNPDAEKNSLESRKIVLDLVLNLEIESGISLKVFKNLQKLPWSSHHLPILFQSIIKSLILSSRFLIQKKYYLDLIAPWLNHHISIPDLKLLTRLCHKSPQLNPTFFSYMFEFSKSSKLLSAYFETSPENSISIFPRHSLSSTKEFSIWAKIQPNFSDSPNTFFSIQMNKSITLKIIFNTRNFKIEMTKGKQTIIVMNAHIFIDEKVWNYFGVCFYLRQKVEGRWKMVASINGLGVEMWLEEIGAFKEISCVQVIGTGKVEFCNLYSVCMSKEEFFGVNQRGCGEEFKNSEVFSLNTQQLTLKNAKFECKATKVNTVAFANILLAVGGVNFLLPLLRKSEEFEVFDLFFKMLIELCAFKDFEELFDDRTFVVLKQILIEKAHLVNMDWLGMCESFFLALKSHKIYKAALENLYFCDELWGNLLDQCLVYYLEAVKNRIKSFKCEITQSYLKLITVFYSNLSKNVAIQSKKMVLYYYFQVLGIFYKHIEVKLRLGLFISTLKQLFSEVDIREMFEEPIKFIKDVFNEKWIVENEEILKELHELAIKTMDSESQALSSTLLALYLKLVRKFYKKKVIGLQKEQIFNFIKGKIVDLIQFTKPFLQPKICQVICEFLILPKMINTPLKFLNNVIIDSLYRTLVTNVNAFNEICQIIIFFCNENPDFSKSICTQRSFPGFFFCFFQEWENINQKIIQLISTLFSHLENFKNFDHLREIFYELIGTKNISSVFKILNDLYCKCFTGIQYEKKRLRYFFEYFNVVEDVISRISYEDLPHSLFLEFLELAVLPLKNFEFSINFPNFSGFGATNFADRKEDELSKNFIVLREGGLVRQILPLLFIGLSFSPNIHIESFFDKFLDDKLNNSDDRIEWKTLATDQGVKKSKILPKGKRYTCQNLIYIYIFVEWAEIIKSYEERWFEPSLISNSLSSFLFFIRNSRLEVRIQEEAKCGLNEKMFKDYERSLNDNWNQIDSFYIKENIYSIRQLYYTMSVKSFNSEDKAVNKQEFLLIKTMKLANKLHQCENEQTLKSLLSKTTKYYEITLFFILLTSFKMNSISQFYTSREIDYRYIPLTIDYPDTPNSPSKILKVCNQSSDYPFIYYFSKIESEHLQFCGFWNSVFGHLTSKSVPDSQGRRIYTKKKPKTEYFSMDSMSCSQNPHEAENLMSQSFSFSIINTEQDSKFDQTLASQTLFELDNILNNEAACQISEFECEIISIKGNLYGQLHLYDDFLVFISKSSQKPEFAVVKIENGSKVLYSSALPESQILKAIRKIWSINDLQFYQPRNFVQNLSALEFFLKSGKSVFFNFFSRPRLRTVCTVLKDKYEKKGVFLKYFKDLSLYQEKWKKGLLSNFEYLMAINRFAGRSFNDINQYPIFPWVLKDYSSEKLDLCNENSFRNLSLPASSQTAESCARLKQTFQYIKHDCGTGYHHGSHYSSAGIVLDYLIRLEPFTTEGKKLNAGSFDVPDRIFSSVAKVWGEVNRCLGTSRELIPEFFYLPELFSNYNKEEFGEKQSGGVVWDVEFPDWAGQNVFLFLAKHRQALESEFVSRNLNHWIDLIFGFKQRRPHAEEAVNVFHPICYSENYKKLVEDASEVWQKAYFHQAYHFGQIPFQLFSDPHPKKEEVSISRTIFDRLISNIPYDLQKKIHSEKPFIPLCSNKNLILLKIDKKVTLVKYKLTSIGVFDQHSAKERVLERVLGTSTLLADLYDSRFVVSSGYRDCKIAVHSLKGKLLRVFQFHTMRTTVLLGGKWIVSASEDSTLVVWTSFPKMSEKSDMNWDKGDVKRLNGHLSSIHSVAGVYQNGLLASTSTYILLHHTKTGEILNKFQETCQRILVNSSNFLFCQCENELKVLYINGFCVKAIFHSKFKPFFVFEDFLVIEERDSLKIYSPLGDFKEKEIFFHEPLDVLQVIHCCTSNLIQMHTNFKKDYLLIQNSGQNFTLYSLDVVQRS